MCWAYEEFYSKCFDNIGGECGSDFDSDSIVKFLEQEYNIKVLNEWQLTEELFKMLTYLHVNHFIEPIEPNLDAKKLYE